MSRHAQPFESASRTQQRPGEAESMVLIVDDDAGMRQALGSLLRSVGLSCALFGGAAELLAAELPAVPSCLLLDVRLRGISGLDLQARLADSGVRIPIIFMTGYGDIPMTVAAMKAGAEDFMTKPFREQDLLDAVSAALEKDRRRRHKARALDAMRADYASLTPREAQVMGLAVTGRLNKQIAADLGISEVTVKIHRGQAMRKMKAATFADLVVMAQQLRDVARAPAAPRLPSGTASSAARTELAVAL